MNKCIPLALLACLSVATLSGCGMLFKDEEAVFRNKGDHYLRSEPIGAIEVPEDMQSIPFEPLYPIPEVYATDEFGDQYTLYEYEVPRPDPINSDEQAFGVKIQKLGDERWIYLSASTSQVWPRTQSFLTSSDLGVVHADASAGVIETAWLQYKDDTENMARFRILLEKGIHPDTTEVHVLEHQLPMGTVVSSNEPWPQISSSSEKEEWLLRELANHLAATIDNASASLLGQNVGGEAKAEFLRAGGEPTLRLRLSRERAWATLTHATRQDGFVTWGKDESKGVVYAGYSETQTEERGFFKRLFSFGDDGKLPEEARYPLDEVLQHLSGSEEVRSAFSGIDGVDYQDALRRQDEGYLVLLKHGEGYADVTVRDQRGRPMSSAETKRLLRLIRKNLI